MSLRRVLLLAYYFPPTPSAGSGRMGGLAKYLPRFGWEATVITPARAERATRGLRVVETPDADLAVDLKRRLGLRPDAALKDLVWSGGGNPSRGLRLKARLIDQVKALVAVPDTNRGWIRIAVDAARNLQRAQRFDALLTTSPPPSVHVAGRRIVGVHRLPWVADLRDLWWDDRYSTAPRWRRTLDRRLEVRTLAHATALVTVSEPLAAELGNLHARCPVHAILNGFDPELVNPGSPLEPVLTLTHTGTLHQGRRDPTLLFAAVARLVACGAVPRDRIRIRLFTRHEPWVAALARDYQIEDVVEMPVWAPTAEVIQAQREAQVLLLLHWGEEREAGVVTAKVFEYLAARRPILVLGGGPGVLPRLLEETAAGIQLTEPDRLEAYLVECWHAIQRDGAVPWRGRPDVIERYSHLRMAREFAAVLDAVSG